MAAKLINLVAVATLAVLASSWGPAPVNALSVELSHNFVRHPVDHHLIAKRQQAASKTNRKRCRARTSTLADPVSTSPATSTPVSSPEPTSQPPQQSTQAPAPAPPSTTPPPATTQAPTTPPPSSGGGGKVGIAWSAPREERLWNFFSWKTSVVYTWSPWQPEAVRQSNTVDFAAMLWGEKHIPDFTALVKPGYCKYILGMNEPNQEGQAWISAGYGADMWAQYIEPLSHQGFITVSPAPTNAPSGLQWLRDWFGACNGRCNPTFIGAHFYGTRSQDLIAHVESYYNAFQKPIWLTEFACQNFGGGAQCSYDQVVQFLRETTGWMDGSYMVDKYFWFGVLDDMNNVNYANKLIGGDDRPNDLGRIYFGL